MLQQTMSVKEAASFLKVKPRTIRDWILQGRLAASRVGRFYIIPAEEVGKLITPAGNTSRSERRAQAAAFRAVLRGGGKINKEAFLQSRQAEQEFQRKRDC